MQIISPVQIGSLVRKARTRKGFTQAELAAQIGVTRQWVGMLERGKPSVELALTLKALAAVDMQISIFDSADSSSKSIAPAAAPTKPVPFIDINKVIDVHRVPPNLNRGGK